MMSDAEKSRRLRRRRKEGLISLRIDVSESDLAVVLVDADLLAVDRQDDKDELGLALERLLEIILKADLSTLLRHQVTGLSVRRL